jgi:hypothetical protein
MSVRVGARRPQLVGPHAASSASHATQRPALDPHAAERCPGCKQAGRRGGLPPLAAGGGAGSAGGRRRPLHAHLHAGGRRGATQPRAGSPLRPTATRASPSSQRPRHAQHGGTPTSRTDAAAVGAPRAAGPRAAAGHTRSGRRAGREAPARRLPRGARAGEQRRGAHPPVRGRRRHLAPAAARALPAAGAPGAGAGRRWRAELRRLRGLRCGRAGAPHLAGGARPRSLQVPGHGRCDGPAGLLPPAAGAGPGRDR